MRGAPERLPGVEAHLRIIPADAGSTSTVSKIIGASEDHPRGCGEHGLGKRSFTRTTGSSPRMRGAPGLVCRVSVPVGIIPADAGSTTMRNAIDGSIKDHPRGCGEHDDRDGGRRIRVGSSPRMRGALDVGAQYNIDSGIIPADAGSTSRLICSKRRSKDHPRGCGEHTIDRRS